MMTTNTIKEEIHLDTRVIREFSNKNRLLKRTSFNKLQYFLMLHHTINWISSLDDGKENEEDQ